MSTAAAFVDATNSRYGLSTKNLLLLGGSEVARLQDMIATDHEWKPKNDEVGGIEPRPPVSGQRIVVKLDWKNAPLACENFATLCSNGSDKKSKVPVGDCGKPLTFRGSNIHRVIPGFVVQGGDFVKGNGSGGESIFGKKFKDERAGLAVNLDRRGLLAMGNSGKNSVSLCCKRSHELTCTVLIKDAAMRWQTWCVRNCIFSARRLGGVLTFWEVVFGELISGMEVLDEIEKHGSISGTPKVPIVISDCGVYQPFSTAGAGYWYDQPDCGTYSGFSPSFIVRPRVAVIAPSKDALERFRIALGNFCQIASELEEDELQRTEQVATVSKLLANFCVDVVLVAPACKDIKTSILLPVAWSRKEEIADEVVIVAKPIDALTSVHSSSWMSRQTTWKFDGNL
eukprot:scaffold5517_cov135-Cylindrotheca_fusiformis.AAC.35